MDINVLPDEIKQQLDVLLGQAKMPADCPKEIGQKAAYLCVGLLTLMVGCTEESDIRKFYDESVVPFMVESEQNQKAFFAVYSLASDGENWPIDPIVNDELIERRLVRYGRAPVALGASV